MNQPNPECFNDGDIVFHRISDRDMLVVCNTSDGMFDCRYLDNNGIFQRQCFYPFELILRYKKINETGFVVNEPSKT